MTFLKTDENDTTRPFRDGDKIVITPEMQAAIIDAQIKRSLKINRTKEGEISIAEWCREKYPINSTAEFFASRQNRTFGVLAFKVQGSQQEYNCETLRSAGFIFEEPTFPELSLKECPEDYLDDRELVLKGLLEIHDWEGWVEKDAEEALKEVEEAMSKYGIVFYRP
jgi:hypothetical protein